MLAVDNNEILDRVKYICTRCEIISWVDHYDDILKREKLCMCCISSDKSEQRRKTKEIKRELYLAKTKVVCNSCKSVGTMSEFKNGNSYRCTMCGTFDVTMVKSDKGTK